MKKIFHVLVISLFCFSNLILSMESAIQTSPLHTDIIMCLAIHCQPHEKNNLMKVCKSFNEHLSNNKKSLVLANPSTVSEIDKGKSLFNAVRADDEEMVFCLLNTAKINPNIKNILDMTPLHYAKKEKIIKLLCEHGAKSETIPVLHPLHEAAYNNDTEAVEFLLKKINPNITLANGITPLHVAVHANNIEITQLLLNANAKVNQRSKNSESPLWIAAKKGHHAIVALLIHHGANDQTGKNGVSPLYIAVKNGHPYCANLLVIWTTVNNKAGGDDKNTPLHIASEYGYTDVIKSLLTLDLNKNEQNKHGETALLIASKYGHDDIVDLLINAKAKTDTENFDGSCPLHIASQKNHINTVRLLIKGKANIDQKDKDGNTPLFIAINNAYTEIVKLLIEGGANIDKENTDDESPLFIATSNDNADIVKLLVEGGANVNKEKFSNFKGTPLDIAAKKGNINIAHILLTGETNINHEHHYFNEGKTMPLHFASIYGHLNMVTFLLSAGADTTRKYFQDSNDLKLTASDLAQSEGHQPIVVLLDNHRICMRELIENGALKASELALRLGYDSHILYNHMLNIKAKNEMSLIGSMSALFNLTLTKYYNALISLDKSPKEEHEVYQEKLSLLNKLSLKDLCHLLSPLNNGLNNNRLEQFEGWKNNLKQNNQ